MSGPTNRGPGKSSTVRDAADIRQIMASSLAVGGMDSASNRRDRSIRGNRKDAVRPWTCPAVSGTACNGRTALPRCPPEPPRSGSAPTPTRRPGRTATAFGLPDEAVIFPTTPDEPTGGTDLDDIEMIRPGGISKPPSARSSLVWSHRHLDLRDGARPVRATADRGPQEPAGVGWFKGIRSTSVLLPV